MATTQREWYVKMTKYILAALVLGMVGIIPAELALGDSETTSVAASDWPQWRGPGRDGRTSGTKWPDRLRKGSLDKLWSVPLGPSYSGPVLGERLVFTTETRNQETEAVLALDRESGEERWRAEWQGAITVPFFAASNGSWIRATPAYDGKCLYVAGMRDVLVCLDAQTGDEKWRVNFVDRFGTPLPAFGYVSSPLVDGNAIYTQAGAAVVKLDKKSGDVVWRTLDDGGGMLGSAFSSPIIANLAGKRQLVVQTRQELAGVDLENGTVLWKQEVPAFRGMNILTPVVVGDAVFTSSYRNKSWLYRITQRSGQFAVETVWSNNVQGYMSTPIVIDGHAYLHLQNRRFACLDLAIGERTWTSQPFAKYASLVAQGDRFLALTANGHLLLVAANPRELEVLGDVQVSDSETWAHLAISGNELFIRGLDGLTCYRWTQAANK